MRHSDIAEMFARGYTKGTASRMFIEDDTVFSYGRHFPICKRFNKHGIRYLFNSRGYSSSTSTHKNYVLNNLSGVVLHIRNCDLSQASEQLRENNAEIERLKVKITKARSKRGDYEGEIEWLRRQNELLKAFAIAEEL